jgi:MYXO-CTERM domain-containing protein
VPAPLELIPVFAREGAIVPRGDILRANNDWTPNWTPALRVEVFPANGFASRFEHHTGSRVEPISATPGARGFTIQLGDLGAPGTLEIYVKGVTGVVRNGVRLGASEYAYDAAAQRLTVAFTGATTLAVEAASGLFGGSLPPEPDAGAPDTAPVIDAAAPDTAPVVDAALPDLAPVIDVAVIDVAVPDAALTIDAAVPDIAAPVDAAVADVAPVVDGGAPDVASLADAAAPDLGGRGGSGGTAGAGGAGGALPGAGGALADAGTGGAGGARAAPGDAAAGGSTLPDAATGQPFDDLDPALAPPGAKAQRLFGCSCEVGASSAPGGLALAIPAVAFFALLRRRRRP